MAARGDGRSAVSGTALYGRGRELDAIRTLITAARAGSGGVLVVEGEPGAGKSALLQAATESAPDFEVLRTRGIQSEAEFAFSGLAELLAPLSELMDELAPEQQRALRSSLDAHDAHGAPAGRLALATAVLALLTSAGRRRPVLVVVDDAHWLDGSSLAAVGFVARRLAGTPIALLAARRGPEPQVGVDAVELRLRGLGAEAARKLLADLGIHARVGARTDHADADDERREPPISVPATREHPSPHLRLAADEFDRLLTETRGNPLALIEMARLAASGALDLATLAGGREPLPSGVQLAGLYHDQVVMLPHRTRRALLVAAASFTGEAAPIEAALDAAHLTLGDLAPAEQSGHVELTDGTVRFAHPLLRSAIYHGATDEAVRDAHRCLVASLATTTGPAAREQHAWHLSYATDGPDPAAATALADVAAAAARRGAPTAARQAYQRAAMIAPGPAPYLIEAAICARVEGDAAAALDLLDAAEAALEDSDIEDTLHNRIRTERSRVDLSRTDPARLITDLAEAAETAPDPAHAADLTVAATAAAILGAHYREARTLAALALERATPTTRAAAHAVTEHLALLLGEPVAGINQPTHSSALPLAQPASGTDTIAEQSGRSLSELTRETSADVAAAEQPGISFAEPHTAASTEKPAPPLGKPAPFADAIAIAELRLSRTHTAAATEKPALPLTEPDPTDLDTPLESLIYPAWTAALRETTHNLAPALKAAHDAGALSRLPPLLTMAAELDQRAGHWDVARGRALAAADLGADLGQPLWPALALAVAARIAAYRSDHTDFADLENRFAALPPIPADHPAALAFRHAKAVLALDEDRPTAIAELEAVADALQAHGIRHPAFIPVRADLDEALDRDSEDENPRDPFQSARRDLQAARRLRERRHHAEARALLEPARDTFRRLGARRWEALCEVELASKTTEPRGLTSYETQVARHVGAGRTNNETAAALYISPKTVEYHLRNLYKKLGIRSRTELARIVATWDQDQDQGPT